MKVSEKCLTSVLEDLERATSLVRKSHIIEDVDPSLIEPLVSSDMWLWSWEDDLPELKAHLRYRDLTKKDLLGFADDIIREALERFADCECAARRAPKLAEASAKISRYLKSKLSEEQVAPRKITDIRVI